MRTKKKAIAKSKQRITSFAPVEEEIVLKLRAAGWIVIDWEFDDDSQRDICHFWGTSDLINCRDSCATRALRMACRGLPIPPPAESEWYSVLVDEETGSEFFLAWEKDHTDTMEVEVIARGTDFRIEQTISKEAPPGAGWTFVEPKIWQRRRKMFWGPS